jgi:hypothetical protein
MKRRVTELTTPGLVDCFLAICLAQFDAAYVIDTKRYTRLYRDMEQVQRELQRREGDQRRALLPLLRHQNVQVRMMAAHSLLAIEPQLARQAMESVRDSGVEPQCFDAASTIGHLDDGFYVPK